VGAQVSTLRTGTESNHVAVIGTDFVLTHTIQDDLSVAVDLTGATMHALVKDDPEDTDANAVATITCAFVATASGQVKMTLPDTETAKLTAGTIYYFDMHVTLGTAHATYPSFDDTPIWGTLKAMWPTTRS
jgi:hypothetical protein